jgi:Flp pilus assembly protein TadB
VSTPVVAVLAVMAVLLWPLRPTPRLPARGRWPRSSRATWRGRLLGRVGRRHDAVTPALGDVADALVLLALALRAGLGLAEALHEVHVGSRGRVRRDLASVVAALQWGKPAAEAWAFASPVWRQVAQAWEVAVQTGSAPADQVELVAQRLRDAQERDREQRAARAGVLLVLPLGFGFLPAFVCTSVVPVVLAVASGVVGG